MHFWNISLRLLLIVLRVPPGSWLAERRWRECQPRSKKWSVIKRSWKFVHIIRLPLVSVDTGRPNQWRAHLVQSHFHERDQLIGIVPLNVITVEIAARVSAIYVLLDWDLTFNMHAADCAIGCPKKKRFWLFQFGAFPMLSGVKNNVVIFVFF